MQRHSLDFDKLPNAAHVRQHTVEKLFACSASTVWRWVHKGLIPSPSKYGGITVWNVGELRQALSSIKGGQQNA